MCVRACVELTLCVKVLDMVCTSADYMLYTGCWTHSVCTRDRNICCVCFIMSHTICAQENVCYCFIIWFYVQFIDNFTPSPPVLHPTPFLLHAGSSKCRIQTWPAPGFAAVAGGPGGPPKTSTGLSREAPVLVNGAWPLLEWISSTDDVNSLAPVQSPGLVGSTGLSQTPPDHDLPPRPSFLALPRRF